MLSLYAQSTQYIEVPVTNEQGINPTSDVVQFAFLGPVSNQSQANEQVPSANTTYYTGLWPSTSSVANMPNTFIAAILVGPAGTVTLTTGTYLMIVRVTDSPEVPVLFSGPISIS